eukprot:510083_1
MAQSECVKALRAVVKAVEEVVTSQKLARTPRIVAVSKLKPVGLIKELYDAGHRHFGENYVQELAKKSAELPKDIEWHFIGHLQSNKCKEILKIQNIAMIETVDSEKLASELNKRIGDSYDKLNIMIQVNTTQEAQKSGISPKDLLPLIEFVITSCPKLHIVGLMTIGKFGDPDPKYFKKLVECKQMVCAQYKKIFDEDLFELSMGMSADYLLATQLGSTNLRMGSTIFGARHPKPIANEEEKKEDK